MADDLKFRHEWTFCVAAMGLWLAYGWPVMTAYSGRRPDPRRCRADALVRPVCRDGRGGARGDDREAAVEASAGHCWASSSLRSSAMTLLVPWAGMSSFLVIIAWQVGMAIGPTKALSWVAFQNLVDRRHACAGPQPRFVLGPRPSPPRCSCCSCSPPRRCGGKRKRRGRWRRPTRTASRAGASSPTRSATPSACASRASCTTPGATS